MRIAIPLVDGVLSTHFGHSESFALVDVDTSSGKILSRNDVVPPPHQPGLLPAWLAEQQVSLILAGGIGSRACGFFEQYGIEVISGIRPDSPERIVQDYLDGKLVQGENMCAH